MNNTHILSTLNKTWIFDIDGTLVKHNGYKIDGVDSLLPGAVDFMNSISPDDLIILLTSRTEEFKDATINFLRQNGIRFNHIIFNVPYGERIVINDRKPSGLKMSMAINTQRDEFMRDQFVFDENL